MFEYAFGVQVTVSIPDKLFAEAEEMAMRFRKSRSQLYAEALRQYVIRHDPDEIMASWNRLCDDPEAEDAALKAFVAEAARLTLLRVEWED